MSQKEGSFACSFSKNVSKSNDSQENEMDIILVAVVVVVWQEYIFEW